MSVRAAATEATRERIVEAAAAAFFDHWYEDVTIRGIAKDAGVALQTVRNHYATKEELFVAAAELISKSIDTVRWAVEPGDIDGALSTLMDDYERTGDSTMRMLAVEERVPVVQPQIATGAQEAPGMGQARLSLGAQGPSRIGTLTSRRPAGRGYRRVLLEAPSPRQGAEPGTDSYRHSRTCPRTP